MITLYYYDGWMMRCWLLPGPAWVLGPGVHATWMGRAKGGYVAHRVWHRVLHPLRRAVLSVDLGLT